MNHKQDYSLRWPAVNCADWTKSLIKKHGVQDAYRIVNPLAVPLFISKKESMANAEYEFYLQAKNTIKRQLK